MANRTMMVEGPVYVVDDDDAVRDSLALLLEASGLRVEAFAAAAEVLLRCRDERPACVITDVRMPGMDGLELQQRLAQLHAHLPVIVITGHGDVPLAVQAMKAGAVDFIEKPFSDEVIIASIEAAVARGRRGAGPSAVVGKFGDRLARLTPREREVFHQLIVGHPNKVIAYNLGISARTVEIHRARVMEKMEVRNLPELVRLAIEAGVEMPS
jgi:two-component system, LuxR family, response regulator FixJ